MIIIIYGGGCKSCEALLSNTKEAVSELKSDAEVRYCTDMAEIAKTGIMRMPALVIDGKVVSMGKVLKSKEVIELLRQ